MSPRRWAALIVTATILLTTALAAREIDLGAVASYAAGMPRETALLVLAVTTLQVVAQATRLWSVYPPHPRPRWRRVARAFGIGQVANACLPARAGDGVKVVLLTRGEPPGDPVRRAATATGAMLADKVVDGTIMVTLAALLAPALLAVAARGASRWAVPFLGISGALLLAGTVVVRRQPSSWPWLVGHAKAALGALRSLGSPVRLGRALAVGTTALFAEAASVLLLARGLGFHLAAGQAVASLVVLNLGIAVPVAIGNLGVYEAALALGLGTFGVPLRQGLAIGVLHHVAQLLVVAVFALVLWVQHRRAARMHHAAAEERTRSPSTAPRLPLPREAGTPRA
jgi:uncharacterized membrane protein YbhN (UPF0104 family)